MSKGGSQHHLWVKAWMSNKYNPKKQCNVQMWNSIHASWGTNFPPKKVLTRESEGGKWWTHPLVIKVVSSSCPRKRRGFWCTLSYEGGIQPLSACILVCWLDSWHSHSSNSAGLCVCSWCENEVKSTSNWIIECHFFFTQILCENNDAESAVQKHFSCKLFAQKESESIVQWTALQCIVKDLTNCEKGEKEINYGKNRVQGFDGICVLLFFFFKFLFRSLIPSNFRTSFADTDTNTSTNTGNFSLIKAVCVLLCKREKIFLFCGVK